MQYALASLGSCQAITYQFWAEQLGIGFDTLSVRVEGDLDIRGFFGFDDSVRPGFSAVRLEVTVTGPESPERYEELAAAVDEHCPVLDLFANPVRCPAAWAQGPGLATRGQRLPLVPNAGGLGMGASLSCWSMSTRMASSSILHA